MRARKQIPAWGPFEFNMIEIPFNVRNWVWIKFKGPALPLMSFAEAALYEDWRYEEDL